VRSDILCPNVEPRCLTNFCSDTGIYWRCYLLHRLQEFPIPNLMEVCPVEAALIHTDRWARQSS